MHVAQNKFAVVAKVLAIHLALVLVNIVGKGHAPARPFQTDAHQSDAGEKLTDSFLEQCAHAYRLYLCTISRVHSISI